MRPLPSDIREHGKTSVLQRVIIQLRENCGFVGAFRKHCDVHRDKEKVLYTYKRQAGCLKKQKNQKNNQCCIKTPNENSGYISHGVFVCGFGQSVKNEKPRERIVPGAFV